MCGAALSKTRPSDSAIDVGKGQVQVWRDTRAVFSADLSDLQQVWDSVSWKICQQRDNPQGADAEHAAVGRPGEPGLQFLPSFDPTEDVAAPFLNLARPRVAELLQLPLSADSAVEIAFLGHRELQASFAELGIAESDRVRAGRLSNPSIRVGRLSGAGRRKGR